MNVISAPDGGAAPVTAAATTHAGATVAVGLDNQPFVQLGDPQWDQERGVGLSREASSVVGRD